MCRPQQQTGALVKICTDKNDKPGLLALQAGAGGSHSHPVVPPHYPEQGSLPGGWKSWYTVMAMGPAA